MIRFYAPEIGENPVLPETESGHCVRVLRMKNDDVIEVVDGRGHLYRCSIADAHPKRVKVVVNEMVDLPKVWANTITLAIAPTKNIDRMEWLVEKLVEIGIDRIVPLRCRYSERKDINCERLEKIAVSAMKQSLKATLPIIDPMMRFKDFVNEIEWREGQKFIGYCDKTIERKLLAKEYRPGIDTFIMIGPEGDFSSEEVACALGRGWCAVTLGDNRLRTETAGLVAVDTCHVLNQLQGE